MRRVIVTFWVERVGRALEEGVGECSCGGRATVVAWWGSYTTGVIEREGVVEAAAGRRRRSARTSGEDRPRVGFNTVGWEQSN